MMMKHNHWLLLFSEHAGHVVQHNGRGDTTGQHGRDAVHHGLDHDSVRDQHQRPRDADGLALGVRRQDLRHGLQLGDDDRGLAVGRSDE